MRAIRFVTATLLVICICSASLPAAEKRAGQGVLAFGFSHADAAKAKAEQLPYFRVFARGKDKDGRDASGTLDTLKLARGASKLYRAEDAKPGLIVVFRRLVLIPQQGGDYKAILEGEFNAVETTLAKATMDKLLAGKRTELVFESETTKGIRPVGFTIKAKTTFHAALEDGTLSFYGGEGQSTITHYALTGNYTYESDPVDLGSSDDDQPVYLGRAVRVVLKSNGEPETLPILN